MKWIILLAALGIVLFALGARFGANRNGGSVAYLPVSELEPRARADIERDLTSGLTGRAVRSYRHATGAGAAAAKAAINAHARGMDQRGERS